MNEKNLVAELVERTINDVDVSLETQKTIGEKIINDRGQTATVINSVSVLTMSGGGEYGEIKTSTMLGEKFAGGAVTLKTIKPQFFVIDNGKGFQVVNGSDPLYSLIGLFKEISDKIKK